MSRRRSMGAAVAALASLALAAPAAAETGDPINAYRVKATPQNAAVQVTAEKSLKGVRLHYRINGGREQTVGTREFRGGERYYKERGG
jgi:hypothetical protein